MKAKTARPLFEKIDRSKASAWEADFLASIKENCLDKDRDLSKKQADVLQRIYRTTNGGGDRETRQIVRRK